MLHTTAQLRQKTGCPCKTICRLMPKAAASEPVALTEPLPAGPAAAGAAAAAAAAEAAPAPSTPRQLEAIAEEGAAAAQGQGQGQQAQQQGGEPPSPPAFPTARAQPLSVLGHLVRAALLLCCLAAHAWHSAAP